MSPLFTVPAKYGAIAGVLGAGLTLGLYAMGRHPLVIPVYMDFRIFLFIIFIFFTLKELRDFHQGGVLFFWQGLFGSLLFTSIFALLAAAVIWTFASASPNFISSYVTQKIAEVKAFPPDIIEKIGKDVYERNLSLLPTTNALDLAILYFTQSLMISFFISIILSVILRRQPKT